MIVKMETLTLEQLRKYKFKTIGLIQYHKYFIKKLEKQCRELDAHIKYRLEKEKQ